MATDLRLENLPNDRFKLGSKISSGVWGILYEADDNKTGTKVTARVVSLTKERTEEIAEEEKVYKILPKNLNVSSFIGIYKKQGRADNQQVYVLSEFCDGGSVGDYVRKINKQNKRLSEDHIAYILRELVKGVVHLHESNIMHRSIKADNVFLGKNGTVKLGNLGLSTQVSDSEAKLQICIGSPCWIAPEIATCEYQKHEGYDLRADVWALGITAIELGDGKPPLQSIHPTRAIFQITRNPPPTLLRPSNWSQLYNDFIAECLEKNPENRPFAQELLEHPFFESIADNEDKIKNEIKQAIIENQKQAREDPQFCDVLIRGHKMEQEQQAPQKLLQEDLAAMEDLNEDTIVDELLQRSKNNQFSTFIGDVLLAINPHKGVDTYDCKDHAKYEFKARSDNAPHIFSVADKAYQDVLHNEEPQHILVAGETMSGKTATMKHAIEHLLFLGKGNKCVNDIRKGLEVIAALGNSSTPHNPNSTRHLLQTQITLTSTGKVSGAIFWLFLLEKSRVTFQDKKHANFHLFYYFYDALEKDGSLPKYNLEDGRDYRYLKTKGVTLNKTTPRGNPSQNPKHWQQFENNLKDLELGSHLESIKNILASIFLLGELDFENDAEELAAISNVKVAETIATLMGLDQKKFTWALLNYCVVIKGEATRRHHKANEASEARHVLAQGIYSRLVDWIICKINEKMSVGRAIFGDKHSISVMDLFGFECFNENTLQQLFINCVNEQLQFHYNQRVFVWEMQDGEEEDIPMPNLPFYDNKVAIDQLLGKPNGLMYLLDDASRGDGVSLLIEKLQINKASHVSIAAGAEFTVAHYTGRVTYDASEFPDWNRDFLPPEMIETLRRSSEKVISELFTGLFSKSGNLTIQANPELMKKSQGRWEAALTAEHEKSRARKYNTESRGQYSQTRQMRTCAATFRGTCLELLRNLAGSCGVHFVRCIRGNLTDQPGNVQKDLLRQQLRAMSVLDTARARQRGYSVRIPFNEFIRRYKFLAFDFDEQVDVTKDNCRLLLIRLKMEGWVIGKTKVFLKYYNEEFLNRLYETQVKKIVKVQSMLRAFLAKRSLAEKIKKLKDADSKDEHCNLEGGVRGKVKKELSRDEAATIIQTQIRGTIARKHYGPMVKAATGKLDAETVIFMKSWCKKWKLKSIFQVLLLYRATRQQDLVYFCQQAHLYNQNFLSELQYLNEEVDLKQIDPKAKRDYLPLARPAVHKLPFRLGDMPYFDSNYICDPTRDLRNYKAKDSDETWDAPLQRNIGDKYRRSAELNYREQGCQTYMDQKEYTVYSSGYSLPETPFVRENIRGVKLPLLGEDKKMEFKGRPQDFGKNQIYKGSVKKRAPMPSKDGRPAYGPIHEMSEKFRQTSGDEDNPPFNFQAMLRKTNNKRESLKRAEGFISPAKNNNNHQNNNNNESSRSNKNNNNYTSYGSNEDNIVFQSKMLDSNRYDDFDESNNNFSETKEIKTDILELAPGFVIHGEVADL